MVSGPFVRAALLCERVLCETDGTLSAIRILDEGPVTDSPLHLVLLLMLVRWDARPGQHRATLQIRNPAGVLVSTKEVALTLDDGGPEQASSLVLDLRFEPRVEGVYWFSVAWGQDARLLTRVPFTARSVTSVADHRVGAGDAHASR